MGDKKNKFDWRDLPAYQQPFIPPGHKAPKTRREALAFGFYGSTGAIMMPSILTLLAERAYGAPDCGTGQGLKNASTPVIIYDFQGGNNLAGGNVLVGTTADQGASSGFLDDAGAARLGTPAADNPRNNAEMAYAIDGSANKASLLFHKRSAFLAGFIAATSTATRANMDGMVFCTRSADDTANNQLNPAFWLQAAGAKGALVDIAGNGGSAGKSNSASPAESLNTASTVTVASVANATALVNQGLIGTLLPGQADKVLKAAHSMSASRLAQFENKELPQQIKDLVECGYIKSVENLTAFTPQAVDPTQDTLVTQAAQTNGFTGLNDPIITSGFTAPDRTDQAVMSTIAKLVIDGYAGVGAFRGAGYDYHGRGRVQQNQLDFKAGSNAGLAFELARLKQKPLVMFFITDGGVSSGTAADNSAIGRGQFAFQADSGTQSAQFMLVYNPKGKPESTGIRQIGAYTNGAGAVDQTTLVGNSIPNLTKAMLLNYMALHGKEGEFENTAKGNPFGAELQKYVGFAKLKV